MPSAVVYNVPHLVYWDWRVATDLFLGGAGVGAFLVAVFTSVFHRDRYPAISRYGAAIAPPLVILGLLLLLSEMGHPFRLWRTLTGFNYTSALSWGGPLQGLLILLSLAYAYLWLTDGDAKLRRLVGLVGAPIALLVGAYHGGLLTAVKARPLWNSGSVTLLALLAVATSGMAAVLLASCVSSPGRRALSETTGGAPGRAFIGAFRAVFAVALAAQCLTLLVWWASLAHGSANSVRAFEAANLALGPLFWVVGIGLGLVVPIVILIGEIARDRRQSPRLDLPLTILTAALVLAGGFVCRYVVVIGGQLS